MLKSINGFRLLYLYKWRRDDVHERALNTMFRESDGRRVVNSHPDLAQELYQLRVEDAFHDGDSFNPIIVPVDVADAFIALMTLDTREGMDLAYAFADKWLSRL
jgi:hypothetical protein